MSNAASAVRGLQGSSVQHPLSLSLAASSAPIHSRVPAGVKSTIQNMPNTLGRHLSDAQIEDLYDRFRTRTSLSDGNAILDKRVTGAARTILVGAGARGFAVMDEESDGDKQINSGSFKTIYHGVGLHDGQHYAIGVCDVSLAAQSTRDTEAHIKSLLEKEAEFATSLNGIRGLVETPLVVTDGQHYYFVMKFYEGGDFFSLLLEQVEGSKKLPLSKSVQNGRQITQCIDTVHKKGIVHRDVKPENFLLDKDGNLVLADLGLAAKVSDAVALRDPVGSPAYIAPEILQGQPASNKSDTWSAGVILYNWFAGKLLPMQTAGNPILAIPRDKNWHPATDFHFGPKLRVQEFAIKNLLAKMLQVDPRARITIGAAATELVAIEKSLQPKPKPRTPLRVSKTPTLVKAKSEKVINPARAKISIQTKNPAVTKRTITIDELKANFGSLNVHAKGKTQHVSARSNAQAIKRIGVVASKAIPATTMKKPTPNVAPSSRPQTAMAYVRVAPFLRPKTAAPNVQVAPGLRPKAAIAHVDIDSGIKKLEMTLNKLDARAAARRNQVVQS